MNHITFSYLYLYFVVYVKNNEDKTSARHVYEFVTVELIYSSFGLHLIIDIM